MKINSYLIYTRWWVIINIEEIKAYITKRETKQIEFKSYMNARSKKDLMDVITKETIAFANSEGGYILLGVEDDGTITGCINYDKQNIIESIYDRTVPKLFTDIEELEIEGKVILVIKVSKSNTTISKTSGESYKRLGKNSKPMFAEQIQENKFLNNNADYSNTILPQSSDEFINYLEVYKFKERVKLRNPESTLINLTDKALLSDLGFVRSVNGENKLTLAGLLFVGKDEAIKKYIPQAEVIYLHYNKSNVVEYDKRIDLRTTILGVLDRLTDIIEDNNKLINIQIGLFRVELKDYPKNVFQEALLNAIAHRNYLNSGAIYVKHYDNKLIIENPGGFSIINLLS